jgi:2-keto-3-deoxy-L-rhamnonate aldolase RhmA
MRPFKERFMDRISFKEICRSRRLCWGTGLMEYVTPQSVRTLHRAGFDWLWIESEHAPQSYVAVQEAVRTANDLGMMSILRVTDTDYPLIAQAYDMGVSGIIVPRVESPEQARAVVDYAKYPPVGKRGFGIRPGVWNRTNMTMDERLDDQNNARFLFIQVESPHAVGQIEAILDVTDDQIDCVIFGPADFQVAVGKPDMPDLPELDAAARHVAEVCRERGVSNGVPVGNVDGARTWIDRGYNLISVGYDEGYLTQAATTMRNSLRELE